MKRALSESELAFIEKRGLMAEDDGQPRIMGRLWGLLMVMEDPITAADMAEMLQVSRGSISTNLKLLGMMNIITRRTHPGERETYYCIADHPYSALVARMAERMEVNRQMAEEALHGIDNPVAQERIKNLAKFYKLARESNAALMDKLK